MRTHRTLFLLALCLSLYWLSKTEAAAPPVDSKLTFDDPTATLTDATTGTYRIDAKGSIGLKTGDVYNGFTMDFKDPNGTVVTPTIIQFKVPAGGTAEPFHFRHYTTVKGKWKLTATYDWSTGNPLLPKTDPQTKYVTIP